ncbi:alpha/beta hydrolase [Methylobacterium indicum]|uniref:Alpha/beta hydrolase n=1 Tax=Methylobacterium indicum TaxID=1775910 RepID=A0ABR5H0R5_9HYPH|nr:alpha/beta hydrolase [Methylobacterium indicum]KMO14325.1 alpha/beta hydrolase [Methylobacterium indicum]KMO16457.1 alpha/beta hydrolase [Methylobacterium indicum]KTS29312.1 alpha/beta hydrolase [Methylobacterium indicum]KTS36010.1 alpha/beta hydrolase [Methylobacterium indicum]KTS48295.1 alpha/beta hydrolase [Methylobacterium indicum]
MTSLRAHIFTWIIRWQVRPKIARAGGDVAAIRRVMNQGGFPDLPGIAFRDGEVGGVPGEWAERPGLAPDAPRLLYLHGGGFIACSPRTHRPFTGGFAARGFRVFCPDYRLAPEHPFPAALDDAAACWSAFAAAGPAGVAGDSAGGNLALALMLRARRDGLPMPEAAVLFSPSTDMQGEGASMRTNAGRDAMFEPTKLRHLVDLYLAGHDPADPLASPLYGDPTGLPPLLFHVGEREVLRDDSVRFADKARAAGVDATVKLWPVVPHVWQLAQSFLPEARRSLSEAAAFLKNHARTTEAAR